MLNVTFFGFSLILIEALLDYDKGVFFIILEVLVIFVFTFKLVAFLF